MFRVEGNPLSYTNVWHEIIGKIFEVEIHQLTEEDVKIYFLENGTLEEWKEKTGEKRKNLKIQGHGLSKIATVC